MLELARPSDREAVNILAREVHAMHIGWRPDIFQMPDELFSEERFDEVVKARQMYVAKINGIIAGYVMIQFRDYDWPGVVRRKVMVISEICVEEAFRNHGIGTRIMEEVHALAKAFDCTDMQLSVYPQNDDAVGFYQKCGFAIQHISMQRKV